ncbi:MAG: hypothetical protein PVF91_14945 [Chromatiales bacterium]|jgi:hypothetical protein
MRVPYSEMPGAHERHLRRRIANPLFPDAPEALDPDGLLEVQRLDHEALLAFIDDLKRLIGEAGNLPPNAESDQVLGLKERLDKAYETACGLADDQARNKAAIRRLIEVIMQAVWKGAAGDPRAEEELSQEEQARAMHFALLEHSLVADLLAPDSPIREEDLVPTLLSAADEELEAALDIFDETHLREIARRGRDRLSQVDPEGRSLPEAWSRLHRIDARLGADQGRHLHS